MTDSNPQLPPASSTGLRENFAAMLAYAFLPAPWVGGIVMLMLEPQRRLVRFHAVQSIITFGTLTLIAIVVWPFIMHIAFLNYILSSLWWLGWFILWLVLVVRAYQSMFWRLPVIGDLAARIAGK